MRRSRSKTAKVLDRFTGTLCVSCKYGKLLRHTNNEEKTYCGDIQEWMPPVEKCTEFRNRSDVDLWELEKMAWIIEAGPAKANIGFVRPSDKRHRKLIEDF